MTERFANSAESYLSAAVTQAATSIPVNAVGSFPTAGNFRIRVDNELMLVTAIVGQSFTVTRGIEGTAAQAHNQGVKVVHILTAAGLSQAIAEGPSGTGAPVGADYLVGTADATLTAEIVVGTTPGGELGGTWAAPTVDATHSGSAHHTQSHDHSVTGDGSSLAPATLMIPGAVTPAQTAEGSAVWDTDGDQLTIGTGTGRKTLMASGDAAGGELAGTYPSPTVAATHSGSAHHAASHVLASGTALGPDHSVSGAAAGEVLRALSATTAAFDVLAHTDLGAVTADQHHAQSHVLATGTALGPDHSISGAAAGEVLRALGATSAAFDVLAHTDLGSVTADQHHAQSHGAADHSGDVLPDGSNQVLGTGDLTITQKTAPTNPAAGDRKVYVDSGTGKLSVRTSAGSSVSLEEQGGSVTFAAPSAAIDIGDAAAEGVAATALRSDAQFAFTAPTAGYPVDVAAAEADGTATTPARADHGHAHGSGYLPDAHHAQSHSSAQHTDTFLSTAKWLVD